MSNTAKQAFSLSNDGGRIVISGNTLTNADADESGRGAIRIVGAATTAKFTISGNTVSGSENAAIYVGGTISGGGAVVANDNDFAGNTVVVRNESNVKVNAALNWWGSATPDFASLAIGSVTTDPFYTDEARSKMSTATPAAPPAADSAGLDQLIQDEGLDVAGTTSEFVLGGGSNSDLSRLDPAQPLGGELPWPLAENTFVDVYAYSTPVYLGTFRVVDGKVQLSASIKSLEGGTHRLVFIGQTSQSVRVMQLTVLALANTGVALSTPFVVGALAIMLGLGLSVTSITMRRRRGLAA